MQNTPLSVTQFLTQLNEAIGAYTVAVEGEVSGFKLNQGKWIFFDLKDSESTVSCFMTAWDLKVPIEDGMKIICHGYPKIYTKSGRFSLTVQRVELSGAGALKRAFELLKAKLEKEGLFAFARKRALPEIPEKIGVITSRDAAAYGDFMKVLNARLGGLQINLAHVAVQGEGAETEITDAFEVFNAWPEDLDAIVLIRGGGSIEDLQAFNTEGVARAIFGSRFPVVVGVGHERDVSIADFVADVRASTPSNAAELLVPHRRELLERVVGFSAVLEQAVDGKLENFRVASERFGRISDRLVEALRQRRQTLQHFAEIGSQRLGHVISLRRQTIAHALQLLHSYDPRNVLQRGYSIARTNGKIIKDASVLREGQDVEVTLAKGKFSSRVTKQRQLPL